MSKMWNKISFTESSITNSEEWFHIPRGIRPEFILGIQNDLEIIILRHRCPFPTNVQQGEKNIYIEKNVQI